MMSSKRKKGDGAEELTGREKKRQRMTIARTIAVQSASVSGTGPSQAGPSKVLPTNSLAGLPSAVDVEKFVEARAFEIEAMQTAMKTASSSSTQRAWQALPRHLRRRAASHDVRRVPLRLRDKARGEMDPMQKKPHSHPRRGKDNKISRTDSFLKRQHDKTWLETHIWHSKRMKMENMWGYRLAVHPTEKAYRPSHRASVHGSIIHDASYFSLVELRGPENVLVRTLELCCDPQGPGPGSKRCIGGARSLDTHLYKPGSYPFDLIAPISIIWKPVSVAMCTRNNSNRPHISRAKKQNELVRTRNIGPSASQTSRGPEASESRTIWLRFHPSVNDEIKVALQSSASQVLQKHNSEDNPVEVKFEIADLKGQVNVFEIMGPKASQVIKGSLKPSAGDEREEFLKFWSSLTDLQTSGSVPRGMVIGFKVDDPRLKFPPKNDKVKSSAQVSPIPVFPSSCLAASEIWDETIRLNLAKPRYTKKDLDDRRAKNPIPGTPLNALRQDDRVPVLLIQRSLETSNSSETQALHGWTVIVPAGWSMPFFSSLTFTGTRVGGQRERQTQAYEAGTPYFPRDYPCTKAYDVLTTQSEAELKAAWERKPPAKRVNYEKLGTEHPWSANWRAILGATEAAIEDQQGFISTQRELQGLTNFETSSQPWLLRGAELLKILETLSSRFIQSDGLFSEINQLRSKRSLGPLSSELKAIDMLNSALIGVKVLMCSRGTPEDLAYIYSMEEEEARQCFKAMQRGALNIDEIVSEETESVEPVSEKNSIVGRVTTGHFSLSKGEGFAIGAIPLVRWLELEQWFKRLHPNMNPLVKIRNVQGQQCRAARLEILLDGFH